MASSMVLLQGPRAARFLMSEVPLHWLHFLNRARHSVQLPNSGSVRLILAPHCYFEKNLQKLTVHPRLNAFDGAFVFFVLGGFVVLDFGFRVSNSDFNLGFQNLFFGFRVSGFGIGVTSGIHVS